MKPGIKLKKRFVTLILTSIMGIAVMPTTAFAQVKGDVNAETESSIEDTKKETTAETIGDAKEEIYGKTEDGLEAYEPMDPLTPDGNLSLVDDLGKANGVGKQFITVVTKTGNYFYIIIDRDDKGEGTVHFLNQVDEADIFKLLSEDEKEEYIASIEDAEKEDESVVEPPVEEPMEPEGEEEKGNNMKGILGIVGIFALAGVGGGYYLVNQRKKKQTVAAPDLDADYVDDEDADDDDYIDLEEGSEGEEGYIDSEDDNE